jgi:hypothetical protein
LKAHFPEKTGNILSFNPTPVFKEYYSLVNSKDSIGIQLTDIFTTALR